MKPFGAGYFHVVSSSRKAKHIGCLEAFEILPEVNAVVNLKARAFSNGRIAIVNRAGKEVPHEYTALLKDPNWYQPAKEFLRQSKLSREIFGNEFMYLLRPVGMSTIKGLFTLPPQVVECRYEDSRPFFLFDGLPKVSYSILLGNNQKLSLDHRDIIHLNDNRMAIDSATDKNLLLGTSKLEALAPALSNLFHAYQSRGKIMSERGAVGVLSPDSAGDDMVMPLLKEEKAEAYTEFKETFGNQPGQHQIWLSSYPVKWTPIELSPSKLGLYEETHEDLNKILDAFGVPAELIVRSGGATYENQRQANKAFYQNVVIPEANEWITAINQDFFPEENGPKAVMTYDHLPIFAEDLKVQTEVVTARVSYLSRLFQDGAITIEEYQQEIRRAGIVQPQNKVA